MKGGGGRKRRWHDGALETQKFGGALRASQLLRAERGNELAGPDDKKRKEQ